MPMCTKAGHQPGLTTLAGFMPHCLKTKNRLIDPKEKGIALSVKIRVAVRWLVLPWLWNQLSWLLLKCLMVCLQWDLMTSVGSLCGINPPSSHKTLLFFFHRWSCVDWTWSALKTSDLTEGSFSWALWNETAVIKLQCSLLTSVGILESRVEISSGQPVPLSPHSQDKANCQLHSWQMFF